MRKEGLYAAAASAWSISRKSRASICRSMSSIDSETWSLGIFSGYSESNGGAIGSKPSSYPKAHLSSSFNSTSSHSPEALKATTTTRSSIVTGSKAVNSSCNAFRKSSTSDRLSGSSLVEVIGNDRYTRFLVGSNISRRTISDGCFVATMKCGIEVVP